MPKPTGNPILYQRVGSDLLACGIGDLEKTECSINYVALGVQGFALMFLLERMKDLQEAIGSMLGVGELVMELPNGFFEMRNLAV